MTSWLYECLCEAELAQYYPHFTALGLQKIDELAKVTMKDYSKLGVHDMNDRKRLFQLIKIIKIMQEEDKAVSSPEHPLQTNSLHIKPQESRSGPRRQLHFDSPADNKDRTTSNNGLEMCRLSDSSVNKQKSSYLKVLQRMLPADSQHHTKTRIRNATAAGSYVQTETNTSLFSSNHFSPILGDYDIPVIQRVPHVSEYNYGIPQSCIRQNTSEKENPWTEMEKIRVCVRKRPLGIREVRRGEINIITVEDKETLLVHEKKEAVDLTQYILQHVFYFDEVFGEACTNRDVYMKTTHPLIQHIFNGGIATCFAYGQTGAGKTYTMIGTHQNPGLYALAAKEIFRQLEVSQPKRHLFVWISFYEIYCGQLYDLLNRRKRLFAREDSNHVVQIVGLQELQVDSVELLLEVILKGSKERSTGATGVNADSSRSHAIIQIQIKDSAKRTFGRISFIDLAGSERAADARDSDRQTKMEGAEINQSLLALKECIRALDQEHSHTPFRQSKLTQVLKDSFIGDAKTCMIANISPSHVATEHTLNTLRYADRVKELKKGIKCCASATSRNRTSGNSSPKRIQSSPVALPGDKCSPKKVKLGLQQSFTAAPSSTRGKAHPLANRPPNIPFAPVPKVPSKRGGSRGSLHQEWVIQTSPVKGATRSGHSVKKREESASLCSEKIQMSHKAARRWGSRTPGPGEDPVHGKLPSKCKKVQTVQPVQKQLVSRVELSAGNLHHLAEYSQGSKGSTPARSASEAWTDIPPHQKEREEHLRFYHQQFQQPPLLQQKLKYQPLERFLCQYRPLEGQLQKETPPPFCSYSESQDGAQTEDLDDSDFSEDSFSHVSSQRTTKQRNTLENSEGSFFLHQREQGPEEQVAERQRSLLFNPRTDGDEKCLTGSWMYSRDPTSHRRAALNRGHSPSKLPLDWSREEDSISSAPSPRDNLAEKPYCSQVEFVYGQKRGGSPAFDLRQNAFRSEVPGQAKGTSPSLEADGFIFSLSHIAVARSPDQRDTLSTPLKEVRQDSPTAKNSYAYQDDNSKGESGTCSEYASGVMAPLTVSLLENTDNEGSLSLEQLAQDGPVHTLAAVDTGGPAVDHTVSSDDQKALLPISSATGHLWLSSSPPDNKPSGGLPALSPSPIRQQPPDKLPTSEADLGGVCESTETALFSQEHVGSQQYDADAKDTELNSSQGFPGKPFPTIHTGGPHPGPIFTPQTESSDMADQPWAQERKHPTGLGWQELSLSTDPIKLSCSNTDVVWLKYRLIPRCLARPGSPLIPSCSPETAGKVHQLTLGHAQQVVIRAHQEQLDEMAKLGFKEETLMSQLALNDFEDFVTQLDEIMALKSKCIQSLRSQLQLYLACHRPATAPERTMVS
ncbi:kinesin-like protein KIF24 isoform X1 [Herpailurus yagouaroundi]|uniref:kinesin-like protein KIF24 isoform X1 n=2 Tax=Herpailurus yagouaroundi TaxID=1608482 RepID=UPI001AD785B2|nr:kinesin-like protein KIF24 isoform X1 [Puma yagouaroundi]XP_040337422.1 kinesin-like protein KIF24 isoform X1 [Puma yagouaroundi]XP_040337423.1 kinesin-like protein KIF24 isoform X1 [Puma yagouaroundi]